MPLIIRFLRGKCWALGRVTRRVLRQERSVLGDLSRKSVVTTGIDDVDTAPENGYGPAPCIQCRLVSDPVDSQGESADYRHTRFRHVLRQMVRRLPSIRRGLASAYHGYRALVVRRQLASNVQHRRHVVDLLQSGGVLVVVPRQRRYPRLRNPVEFGVGVDAELPGGYRGGGLAVEAGGP